MAQGEAPIKQAVAWIEERLRNDRGLSMSSASILTASEVRQGYK